MCVQSRDKFTNTSNAENSMRLRIQKIVLSMEDKFLDVSCSVQW